MKKDWLEKKNEEKNITLTVKEIREGTDSLSAKDCLLVL
jgi:hypothetical protein